MKNNTTIHSNPLVTAIMLSSISAAIILPRPSGTADMSDSANSADAANVSSQTQKIISESKIKLLKQPYVNQSLHLDF
jgi:hypothetical protein